MMFAGKNHMFSRLLIAVAISAAGLLFVAVADEPEQQVKKKDGKVYLDNDIIDNEGSEGYKLDRSVGRLVYEDGKYKVLSKVFTPPAGFNFKGDEDDPKSFVEVLVSDEDLDPIIEASSEKISITALFDTNPSNAGKPPFKCEGNLVRVKTGGGRKPEQSEPEHHWSAVVETVDDAPEVNLDIARLNGVKVTEIREHPEGSITKVLHPDEASDNKKSVVWRLKFVTTEAESDDYELWFEKLPPTSSPAKCRILDGERVFMELAVKRKKVTTAFLKKAKLSVEFIEGGVMDFRLAAYKGTSIVASDTVRGCGIMCAPAKGRIVYVNPSSLKPSLPYTDFALNASHDIASTLRSMEKNDNVVIARGETYIETGLKVLKGGVIAGLGGKWIGNPHGLWKKKAAYVPEYEHFPVVNGNSDGRVFEIKADDVSLAGMVVTGGNAAKGSAVLVADRSDLLFCALKMEENIASEEGGALYVGKSNSSSSPRNVTLESSHFAGNVSADGGGVCVSNIQNVAMTACRFSENISYTRTSNFVRGGGVLIDHCSGRVMIRTSLFDSNLCSDNYAKFDNGMKVTGPFVGGYPRGNAGPWIEVTKRDIGAYGGGMAVWHGDAACRMLHNVFLNNTSFSKRRRARGGGVSFRELLARASIIRSVFGGDDETLYPGNFAEGNTRASGGAIDLFSAEADVIASEFNHNQSKSKYPNNLPLPGQNVDHRKWRPDFMNYGGAIAFHHGAVLKGKGCRFDSNYAVNGAGGGIAFVGRSEAVTGEGVAALGDLLPDEEPNRKFLEQKLDLQRCVFVGNKSALHGGAIAGASTHSSGKVVNCTFGELGDTLTGNMSYQPAPATVDADAGAIAFQANALGLLQPLELENCSFFWNSASDGGGACKAGGLAMISAVKCNFGGNTANGSGGAFRSSTIGRIECDSSKFMGHRATGVTLDLDGSPTGHGGAISCDNSRLIVTNCDLKQNWAKREGGALLAEAKETGFGWVDLLIGALTDIETTVSKTSISENAVDGKGGACAFIVRERMDLEVSMDDTRLSKNDAGSTVGVIFVLDSLSAPSFQTIYDFEPDAIYCYNETQKDETLVLDLKTTQFAEHDDTAVVLQNEGPQSNCIQLNAQSSLITKNGQGIVSAYSDVQIAGARFSEDSAIAAPWDIVITSRIKSPSPNNQKVRISGTTFAKHPGAVGILVARSSRTLSDVDVAITNCSFVGRQVDRPGIPWQVESKGAIIVVSPINNNVSAQKNYWDSPFGPHAVSNLNRAGSYVSRQVDYQNWLEKKP